MLLVIHSTHLLNSEHIRAQSLEAAKANQKTLLSIIQAGSIY